jgi:Tol biopolymer transport system component
VRIGILFMIIPWLILGCNKKSDNPAVLSEVISYDQLNGIIAFSRNNGKIMILNGNTKTDTTLIRKDLASFDNASVSLSADGEIIAYSANTNEGAMVFRMSVKGSNNLTLTKNLSGFVEYYICPIWSSDGANIYYVDNGYIILGPVFSIKPDGSDLKQITKFNVYRRISVSKDKSFIAYASSGMPIDTLQGIYLYFIQNDSIKKIKTYNSNYTAYSPVLSPDEKKIAFILRHGPNEQGTSPYFYRIITINNDGTNESMVIELPDNNVIDPYVIWSPDGTKLAYNYGVNTINGDQGSHIFILNSDGTGLVQVTHSTDYDGAPSWIK